MPRLAAIEWFMKSGALTNRFISSQRLQADTPEIRQQIIDQLERDLEC